MTTRSRLPHVVCALAMIALGSMPRAAEAQGGPGRGPSGPMRQAAQLDLEGKGSEARVIFVGLIDSAADPAAKAQAQRAMAMSYAFAGDCANTLKYEQLAIDYWKTREQADPQNAFYQEGELADEGARVCIDAGDLDAAEQWYRKGFALGTKEPAPQTHPKSLWDFRLAHALGRIAARRGDKAEAKRQIAAARRALDSDSAMAAQQERFFPYLTGYVALYTGDLATAQRDLEQAIAERGNQRDPFMHCLLAMTYEKLGRQDDAKAMYRQAYDLARAHNPPAAFVVPYVRKKLGLPASR
jgi:tetratricopeptide (TPR) repeat protein